MAGYLIAVGAFTLAFAFGATGIARARVVIGVGGVLAFGWLTSLAIARGQDVEAGRPAFPVWFLVGLVALLYVIWCAGFWLGARLRRMRTDG